METTENELKARIAELIGAMASTYPSVELTAEANRGYVAMLADLPLPVLTAAVEQCVAELRFLPTVADIRERALALMADPAPAALEAWRVVVKEIDRCGLYKVPKFDDPVIRQAVECIGWRELCNSDNQVADRAHFSKIYEQLVNRKQADQRLLPKAREIKALKGQSVIAQIGRG